MTRTMRQCLFACLAFVSLLFAPRESFAQRIPLRWQTVATFQTDKCWLFRLMLAPEAAEAAVADCNAGWWIPTDLPIPGYQHFQVNELQLETRTRPNSYRYVEDQFPLLNEDGVTISVFSFRRGYNTFEAFVPWPRLRQGANTITFSLGPLAPNIGESANILWLDAPGGSIKLKSFALWRNFWEIPAAGHRLEPLAQEVELTSLDTIGCTPATVTLSPACMREAQKQASSWWDTDQGAPTTRFTIQQPLFLKDINPNFDKAIAALERAIVDSRDNLLLHAPEVTDLEAKIAHLDALPARIDELLNRGLDNITSEDLDKLLSEFPMIPDSVRTAVATFVDDTKKTIDQLRKDLADIQHAFQGQADSVAASVYQNLGFGGYDPRDPSHVSPRVDLGAFGSVALPSVGGGFDPKNDPYDAYAKRTIDLLDVLVGADKTVRNKQEFGQIVRGWDITQSIWQRYLDKTHPSGDEVAAFVRARNKMTDFLRQYLDSQGWFLDCPVPQTVRTLVDGTYVVQFGAQGTQLKSFLNAWSAGAIGPEHNLVLESVRGLGQTIDAVSSLGLMTEEMASIAADDVAAFTREAGRLAVGAVPFLGDGVDICEAFTGREFCSPTGRKLDAEERAFAYVGILFGSGKMWRSIESRLVKTEERQATKMVADIFEGVTDGCLQTKIASALPISPCRSLLGKLTFRRAADGSKAWVSTAGLVYEEEFKYGNRVKHVLAHLKPAPAGRPLHTMWSVGREEVLSLIDEAWLKRALPVATDPSAYIIPMNRVVGQGGERSVKIIVKEGTSIIMTAYPVP